MSVAYLFLVYDKLHPIWKLWFPNNENNIYVHSKYELINENIRINQIERIETQWGHISLVEAMLQLLKNAMINESITHFVFLSGNCIPIFNYYYTTDRILHMEKSNIHLFHKRNKKGIHNAFNDSFIRHSQWCIFIRNDVDKILSESYTHLFTSVAIPDENYFGTLLNYYNVSFDSSVTTYVNWHKKIKKINGKSPYMYRYITDDLIYDILQHHNNSLFIRKVEHNLELQYVHTFNTLSDAKNIHTVTFFNMNEGQ